MLPTGTPAVVVGRVVALKLAGEVPIEQLIWAPVQHCNPMVGLIQKKRSYASERTFVLEG